MRYEQTFQVDLDELMDLESKGFSKDQVLRKQVKPREVVGESYYQQALVQLAAGIGFTPDCRREDAFLVLALKRDYANKQDRNAVAVFAGPLLVGYVAKADAERLAPKLDAVGGTSWAGGLLKTNPNIENSFIGVQYWLDRMPSA